MKNRIFVLALVFALSIVCISELAAQNTATEPVTVVNTAKNPVPTVAQGTTTISGSVNVTNSSIPVTGSVSIANSSLPVTGTVNVGNLPLSPTGNVLVSIAPATIKYQFQSIVAFNCTTANGLDYCYGAQNTPIEQTLTTLSGQGYELFSVVAVPSINQGSSMLYTLQLPLTGARQKGTALPSRP